MGNPDGSSSDRMTKSGVRFRAVPFPVMRRIIVDFGRHWRRASYVYGLCEFDVTRVREYIQRVKEHTGEALSFTAYIITCLARAVAANRTIQAYRNWRNQFIIFEDVDVSLNIEIRRPEGVFPILHVIRAAHHKSFREIHDEIRSIQTDPKRTSAQGTINLLPWFLRLPQLVRDLVYWFFWHVPTLWKQQGGTVGVTSLGMFTRGGGFGIPITNYPLSVCIGGIAERPAYVGETLMKRQFLDVTIALNHDTVDGGPATRFANAFRELVESGSLLPEPSA